MRRLSRSAVSPSSTIELEGGAMRKRRWRLPSPALVIALLALFVALGGTTYAATSLPKNSVGTKQLRNNAVTSKKIRNATIRAADIKNGAVKAAKIDTTGLTVPEALHAASADSATSLAPMEAWHEVGGTVGEPVMQNGWTNFGTPWSTLAFAKDSAGFVHLRGAVGNLTGGAIPGTVFTLPEGYRPAHRLFIPLGAQRNGYILTDGEVIVYDGSAGAVAGFDGLSFQAG